MEITQVSFSKGEISPITADRTDQALYANALQICQNFFVRAEGGVSNRPGTMFIGNCLTNTPGGSYLLPFVYNNQQTYVVEFAAGSMQIYSQGAFITNSLTNPYVLTDLINLRYAQSADVLSVVVQTQPMYQLTRVTATSFTYTVPQILFGPFQDLNTDGTTYLYASGTQGTVEITASKAIFLPTHVGALVSIQEQYLASIQPWSADTLFANGGASVSGQLCRSDGKIYQAIGPPGGGNTLSGDFQPVHTQGSQWDGNRATVTGTTGDYQGIEWQFVSTDTGIALITAYIDSMHVTAVVQSFKGITSAFPPTVVGGPVISFGPITFTGNGTTKTFGPLTSTTTEDPNQYFVTIAGIFQDPSLFTISSASAGNIVFASAPAAGAAISVAQVVGTIDNFYLVNGAVGSATPLQGLCLSTYWALGSISQVQGFASDVCYYNDRLVLAGTTQQPQTLFTSQVSNYLVFGVSDPQVDSDAITETVNARQQNPINNLLPMNNLLLGTASASWRVTDSTGLGAITPSDISLLPQEFYGMQPIAAVQTGTTIIYAQWGGRKIRDIIYQFYNDKFLGTELTVFARQMFPFGTTVTRMAFAPEPYGLLFCVRSDGVMCVCAYLPEQQVLAWSRYVTQGNFEDVLVVPENNSFSVYVIVGRTIQGVYQRTIERFAAREYATADDAFFVDCGLTYDGRNHTTATMTFVGTSTASQSTGLMGASSIAGFGGFSASDATLGNQIWLYDAAATLCRFLITAVNSSAQATVKALDTVPADLFGVATTVWTFARTTFTGLNQLSSMQVSVFADGGVQPPQIVSGTGSITLQNAGGVVHAGLSYVSQLQSLNLNEQGQESIRNRSKTIPRLSVVVDQSLPFEAGPDFEHLSPVVLRQYETYNQPITPFTGLIPAVTFQTQPTDDAYVCIQQSDPVPVTVLGWLAQVDIGAAP